MKISELIKKLAALQERHGDNDLRFTVRDAYSRFGSEMTTGLKAGEETGLPSDWEDVFTVGQRTTIYFTLNDEDGKKPKITFRK